MHSVQNTEESAGYGAQYVDQVGPKGVAKLETLSPETPSTIVPVALTWRGPGVRFHGLKYYIIIYSQ